MNAKRCKRIRRALQGLPVAKLEMEYTTVRASYGNNEYKERAIPLTFKYPKDSYQRVYRDVKRYA